MAFGRNEMGHTHSSRRFHTGVRSPFRHVDTISDHRDAARIRAETGGRTVDEVTADGHHRVARPQRRPRQSDQSLLHG